MVPVNSLPVDYVVTNVWKPSGDGNRLALAVDNLPPDFIENMAKNRERMQTYKKRLQKQKQDF